MDHIEGGDEHGHDLCWLDCEHMRCKSSLFFQSRLFIHLFACHQKQYCLHYMIEKLLRLPVMTCPSSPAFQPQVEICGLHGQIQKIRAIRYVPCRVKKSLHTACMICCVDGGVYETSDRLASFSTSTLYPSSPKNEALAKHVPKTTQEWGMASAPCVSLFKTKLCPAHVRPKR